MYVTHAARNYWFTVDTEKVSSQIISSLDFQSFLEKRKWGNGGIKTANMGKEMCCKKRFWKKFCNYEKKMMKKID